MRVYDPIGSPLAQGVNRDDSVGFSTGGNATAVLSISVNMV